jgi:hypothetical protein
VVDDFCEWSGKNDASAGANGTCHADTVTRGLAAGQPTKESSRVQKFQGSRVRRVPSSRVRVQGSDFEPLNPGTLELLNLELLNLELLNPGTLEPLNFF